MHTWLRVSLLAALTSAVLSCSGPERGKGYNVLLLTLDTTRADHLGCYGDAHAMTPSLDRIAAAGALFEHAYAPSPLTLPSHATMLTGLNPNEHGLALNNTATLSAQLPTLATVLAERGYRTAAFIASPILDSRFGLDRGFEVYNDDMRQAVSMTKGDVMFYRQANVVVDAALQWLGARPHDVEADQLHEKPFFLWVHLYDPHRPLFAHEELAGTRFAGEATYQGEIAFMDRHIGRLTSTLDAARLSERTLIVAVGDHGEELGDHGDPAHGLALYQEVLRVPLLVALPGVVRAGHRVDAVVSLRDLLPTVLDLLGLPAIEQGKGRSLKAALEGQPIPSEPSYAETQTPYNMYRWSPLYSLTTEEWKYIRTARPELYDRKRDPAEMYNLATVFPERLAELESALASHEAQAQKVPAAKRIELNEAEIQRMRQLGYLVGQDAPTDDTPRTDLRGLRDVKDAIQARLWDWTMRWAVHISAVDPGTVAAVARELLRHSPESPGFEKMLEEALTEMGKPLEESLPEPDFAAIRARNEAADRIVEPFRADLGDPDKRARAHFEAGLALAKQGLLDNALGHYFALQEIEPENFSAQIFLAQIFRTLGRQKQTIEHLERAVALKPLDAAAQYNLGLVYTEAKDYDRAADHYRKAIAAQPDHADARNNLAFVLMRSGQTGEAEKLLRDALRVNPSLVPAHLNLAQLLTEQKRYAEAIAEYERLLQINPAHSQSASRLAQLLATCEDRSLRDPARALQLATGAVAATREKNPAALVALGRAHAALGNQEAAMAAARKALPLAVFAKHDDLIAEIEKDIDRYRREATGS